MHFEYRSSVCKERRHPCGLTMRTTWLFAGLVVFASSYGCEKFGGRSEVEYIARAQTFYESGQTRASVIEAKNVLKKNPNNVDARHLLAKNYIELGHPQAAESELMKAQRAAPADYSLELTIAESLVMQQKYDAALTRLAAKNRAPENARLLHLKGEALLGLGRPLEACPLFEEAIRRDAKFVPGYWGLAKCAGINNDRMQAAVRLKEALRIDAKNARTWTLLGDFERGGPDLAAAEGAYSNALRSKPEFLDALFGRAAVYIQRDQFDLAKKDIKRLTDIGGESIGSYMLQGMLAYRQREYKEAKAKFDLVLQKLPDFLPAVLWAGYSEYSLQNYGQASKHFYKYLLEHPEATEVRGVQALTQARLGKRVEAESLLKAIQPNEVENLQSLTTMGLAYIRAGNPNLGVSFLSEAAKRAPNSPIARMYLAQAYIIRGNTDSGLNELEAAIKLNPKDPAPHILRVRTLMDAKRYDAALEAANRLPSTLDRATIQNIRGEIYSLQGREDVARSAFEEALRIAPGSPAATENLARIEVRRGGQESAKSHYRAALKIYPNDFRLLHGLYTLEKQSGKIDVARKLLVDFNSKNPTHPGAAVLLARDFLAAGEPAKALQVMQQAASAHPDDAALLETRGNAHLARGDARSAVVDYQHLASLEPASVAAHMYLAQGQVAAGDYASARSTLQRVLELKPNDLGAQSALARLYLRDNQPSKAIAMARQIGQANPQVAEGALIEAEVLQAQNRAGEAIPILQRALGTHPASVTLVVALARSYWALGQRERALDLVKVWISRHRPDEKALAFLGEGYESLGRVAEAKSSYEALLRQAPNHRGALNNLAWLLRETDPAQALQYAERAYRVAPADPDVADTLGWLLLTRGNTERGEILLKQAAESSRTNLTHQYHYAVALERVGKTKNAERILGKIVLKPFPERNEALALLAKIRS